MKKITAYALITALICSGTALPVSAESDGVTARQFEKLNRGVAAVPTDGGMYISWRLHEDEDVYFGTAEENVSFDIYRDGEIIATERNTTNYIDANGTSQSSYTVVKSGTAPVENEIKEIKGSSLTVTAADTSAKVYAAKYDNGVLDRLAMFDIEEAGESTFDAGFDIDKAFIWEGMMPGGGASDDTSLMLEDGYITIPLTLPEDETITDSSGNSVTYSFAPTDCSVGDLDGDGEYEIVVKFVSHELDVGNAGYSGTTRFNAYKLDGTRLWENDIDLGRNVFSSAHTAQFLVYDFDGDGKAEMTVQTSLGSKDAAGEYVSGISTEADINAITDTENANADFREAGNGRITSGEEFLTVFDGETGTAIDTISYPTARYNIGCWGKNDGGNRSQRFLADVAYLDGVTPYAVYWRGYYNHENGRTGVAGVSFDGSRLSVDYIFDTLSGQPGYSAGNELYAGQGNHNLTVADVDGDGCDEVLSGAMCMEVADGTLKPRWCTFKGHGDALHIGDYDPTHPGYEFFTVHEEGGAEWQGVTLDYGMSVIDAGTGEIMFHVPNTKDTGRGMMANIGSGGYYQINGVGNYQCNGGEDFEVMNGSLGNNFRIFWDGDLYDELLNGTSITSWNGSKMAQIFNADGCTSINGTKANPSLQADLFGDWREEVVYPTEDGTALRVYMSTEYTDYKIKSLMYDSVYRSGVAAEQTTYNQPPHIGFYLSEDSFYGKLTGVELDTSAAETVYYLGDPLDTSALTLIGKYSNAEDRAITGFGVIGYDPFTVGEQTVTAEYLGHTDEYTVNVIGESGITADTVQETIPVGTELSKSAFAVSLIYEDGAEKPVTDYSVSDYDPLAAGKQTVTIAYTGAAGDVYTASAEIETVTGLVIENGTVTGFAGEDTEVHIPCTYNGEAVMSVADGAFAQSAVERVYIYSDTLALDGDNIFPAGVTLVCTEDSAAYAYALEHGIAVELLKQGDSVTFDEEFYAPYEGGALLMQTNTAAVIADEFISFETVGADSGAPWFSANTYGFSIASDSSGNRYLSVNSGIYDDRNSFNQVYITLNEPASADEPQAVAFDIMIPSGGTPYVELQNGDGTVIDTISGLTADTWFRYELTYENGEYTSVLYGTDGNIVSENAIGAVTGSTAAAQIVFKQGFSWGSGAQSGVVNIDNILIS